ncbi:MAG: peptide chain release factor N(5)-glutamine methyltransferase [Blastomonas sp.]
MSESIAAAIRLAAQQLAETGPTPRLDAELLMAHALDMPRETMLLHHMQGLPPAGFAALVARRVAHEPLAYITGTRDFWTLTLEVGPDVLIPRADSETLIEAAIAALEHCPPRRIVDLGTGSGALLLAALAHWGDAQGTGIDASEAALAIARRNARRNGLAERAAFQPLDWTLAGWTKALGGRFDLVLANPPYVESGAALAPDVMAHEPHDALFAGADGMDDYRVLIPALPALLAPGGVAVFEIGAGQEAAVTRLARDARLQIGARRDLAGHVRALTFSQNVAP